MRIYPGYKYEDVLDMPSSIFLDLLDEGMSQKIEDWKFDATVAMAPEMKSDGWKRFVKELDRMSSNTDILEEEPHEVSIEKLKKIFGQK